MADRLAYPDSNSDEGNESTPRWVKVFGIITVLLLLFVVWHLVGGGHGPGQHLPSSNHTASSAHRGQRP